MARILAVPVAIIGGNHQTAIIGVAEDRHLAIRQQHAAEIVDHLAETLCEMGAERLAKMLREPVGAEEQLDHKAVVGHGGFKVRPIRQHLDINFLLYTARREIDPLFPGRQVLEEGADEMQADDVREVVVGRGFVGVLEIGADEDAVVEQAGIRVEELFFRHILAIVHQIQRDGPVGRADADIHRAGPVDADAGRIFLMEVTDFVQDFLNEPRFSGDAPGLCQREEMLAAGKLPRELHIGILGPVAEKVPFLVRKAFREAQFTDGIVGPVDRLVAAGFRDTERAAGMVGAGAEQIELVAEDGLGIALHLRDTGRMGGHVGVYRRNRCRRIGAGLRDGHGMPLFERDAGAFQVCGEGRLCNHVALPDALVDPGARDLCPDRGFLQIEQADCAAGDRSERRHWGSLSPKRDAGVSPACKL